MSLDGGPPGSGPTRTYVRRLRTLAAAAITAGILAACSQTGTPAPTAPRSSAAAASTSASPSDSSPGASTAATPSPSPTPTRTVIPAKVVTHPVYIERVKVGACFNTPKSDVNGYVPVLSTCAAPHDNQLMGQTSLGKGKWPGNAAEDAHADTLCEAMFRTFVGVSIDNSTLDYQVWEPDEATWKAGDHVLLCSVDNPTGKTIGTLRGAKT